MSWRWELSGTRKSGETTTSLGNGLINRCIFLYYLKFSGDTGRMVCRGDDTVAKVVDFDLLVKVYNAFGLEVEA